LNKGNTQTVKLTLIYTFGNRQRQVLTSSFETKGEN